MTFIRDGNSMSILEEYLKMTAWSIAIKHWNNGLRTLSGSFVMMDPNDTTTTPFFPSISLKSSKSFWSGVAGLTFKPAMSATCGIDGRG